MRYETLNYFATEAIPIKYANKFKKFMDFENNKLNRILQDDLDRFRKKLPKKYQNLIVARIDYRL